MTSTPSLLRLLSAAPNWAETMLEVQFGSASAIAELLLERFATDELVTCCRLVLTGGAATRASFLLSARAGHHPIIELAHALPGRVGYALLAEIACSDSLYIPFDLRAAAFAAWPECCADKVTRLGSLASAAPPTRYKDLASSPSNDIDHDFEIPDGRASRDALLMAGARSAMIRDRARLARRALGGDDATPPLDAAFAPSRIYVPDDAEGAFAPFASPGLDWRDFIIEWNEVLVPTPEEDYTTAELLRLLLLDLDYHLPGRRQRAVADATHLNLLRLFSGATLGLRSGVLFVEHGFRPEASLFLFGESAILGKACVLDGTGVVVVEPHAFLGGGLSPILIHTHKHVAGGGIVERKAVRPVGFLARRASRLPMQFVGLLEVADLEPTRWPGLERMAVKSLSRGEVWSARGSLAATGDSRVS